MFRITQLLAGRILTRKAKRGSCAEEKYEQATGIEHSLVVRALLRTACYLSTNFNMVFLQYDKGLRTQVVLTKFGLFRCHARAFPILSKTNQGTVPVPTWLPESDGYRV